MRLPLLILITTVVGCANRAPTQLHAASGSTTISVGQEWPQARAVARRAGYDLHDAARLATSSTLDGFYVDMPGRRGLLVIRDARRNAVKRIEWIENWPAPKADRVYHEVESFDVPPADAAAP